LQPLFQTQIHEPPRVTARSAVPRPAMASRTVLLAVATSLALTPVAHARTSEWASTANLASARSAADAVVVAFIDKATQPRGTRGICPAHGYVAQVERGIRLAVGRRIWAHVPCAVFPENEADMRRIAMRHMSGGTWARLYYSGRDVVDYEPLRLAPAP
jgi:hypothetical protein